MVARVLAVVAQRLHPRSARPTGLSAQAPAQQHKREAHGKAPLYSWHTVTIAAAPEVAVATPDVAGRGTHASPREHARCGHWRTYATGRREWVRDCLVDDASRGGVFKDYVVAARLAQQWQQAAVPRADSLVVPCLRG